MRAYPLLHFIDELGPSMSPESRYQLFWPGFTAFGAIQIFVSLAHFLNGFKVVRTFDAFIDINRHFASPKNGKYYNCLRIFLSQAGF